MNNISDKFVMVIILLTILFVFGLVFSVKSPETKVLNSPIIWKDDLTDISVFRKNKLNYIENNITLI
tara:strand:+ start:769 stop:969 length:201 start_codon:yes stop_codon:yes gene_type:complete